MIIRIFVNLALHLKLRLYWWVEDIPPVFSIVDGAIATTPSLCDTGEVVTEAVGQAVADAVANAATVQSAASAASAAGAYTRSLLSST
jgi:hypothetical protein